MKAFRLALGLASAFAILSGCGESNDAGTFSLVDAANDGFHYDYEPLESPRQAQELADVILVGTIVGAQEATEVRDASTGRDMRYAVIEVAPTDILSGVPHSPDRVYVAFAISRQPEWDSIERGLPDGRVLLVLDDLADWRSGQRVGFPDQAYAPFTDGFWIESASGEVIGLWVEPDETASRWYGDIESLDDLAALIREAGR